MIQKTSWSRAESGYCSKSQEKANMKIYLSVTGSSNFTKVSVDILNISGNSL